MAYIIGFRIDGLYNRLVHSYVRYAVLRALSLLRFGLDFFSTWTYPSEDANDLWLSWKIWNSVDISYYRWYCSPARKDGSSEVHQHQDPIFQLDKIRRFSCATSFLIVLLEYLCFLFFWQDFIFYSWTYARNVHGESVEVYSKYLSSAKSLVQFREFGRSRGLFWWRDGKQPLKYVTMAEW